MKISLIVAVADNQVIGGGNKLLWDLPNDLKHFRAITDGHPIIMGRKTHDSIGRALPGRLNLVISRDKALKLPGCIVVSSFEEALREAEKDARHKEAFVIGGGEIYRQTLPLAHRVYLTRVYGAFEGDTFFPKLDPAEWQETEKDARSEDDRHLYAYTFSIFDRKNR